MASDPDRKPAPPRPKHMLDPDNLAESHRRSQGSSQSLDRVQRWVLSVLAVTTIAHLAAGFVVAAVFIDPEARAARIGLNLLAMYVGIGAVAAGLAIHRRRVLSWWLLLGLLPGLLGLWLTFG